MSEVRRINPALTLAEAWQRQLFQQYWDTQELLARCNMVGAALQVRDEDPTAKYVVFEDSDQGRYAYLCGGTTEIGVPWNEEVDTDLGNWELRYDVAEHWAPFLDQVPTDRSWGQYHLDIDKVLAEVPTPWGRATGLPHCKNCLKPISMTMMWASGSRAWATLEGSLGRTFCSAAEGNPHEPVEGGA